MELKNDLAALQEQVKAAQEQAAAEAAAKALKKDLLVKQVVDLAVNFINAEGGLSLADLYWLFGDPASCYAVPAAIGKLNVALIKID